ncbi:MAG TPA: hypothetical protein VHB54_19640 [Mucilaginibacter sp.]|nr:hypothetical protein [Mucilaginibacter sp.]
MPETPMYKYHGFIFGQYNVRFAGQVFHMQPVAETIFVQKLAHQYFRLGILTPYPRHIVAAGFLAVHVGHVVKLAVFNVAAGGHSGKLIYLA